MSNITTAYFEIVRLDGGHITPEEQDWLFRGLVRAYNTFGSFWVRIHRAYEPQTRRMWIQYGMGKTYGDFEDFIEDDSFLQQYALWLRSANDGNLADGLFYSSGLSFEGVPQEQWEVARYGFDSVVLAGTLLHPVDRATPFGRQDRRHLLSVGGSYTTLTDRGFVNLGHPFYGPRLDYDPQYQPARYTRLFDGNSPHDLKWESEVTGLSKDAGSFFPSNPCLDFVTWCWLGRAVQVNFGKPRPFVDKFADSEASAHPDGRSGDFKGMTADGWTNLVNPSYLTFRAWHAEQVHWAGMSDPR